jgi:phosphopantetheinyl transferase
MIIVLASQEQLLTEIEHLPELIRAQGALYSKVRQRSFFSGRLLLKKCLHYFFDCESLPPISVEAKGRPLLEGQGLPFFSLSHTGKMVAIALGFKTLGLDVEQIKPRSEALWQRVLSPQELTALKNSSKPQELFTLLWTVREALLKTDGRGLGGLSAVHCNLETKQAFYRHQNSGQVRSWRLDENLCMSAYVSSQEPQLHIYRLEGQNFIPLSLSPQYIFTLNK